MVTLRLAGHPAFRSFVLDHGLDLLAPSPDFYRLATEDEEEIRSTAPFEGRSTYATGDDTLTMTIDEALNVVDVSRED